MTLHPDIERIALLGWHLYPATRNGRKAAMFKGATDKATCEMETLERWQHEYPEANWRVVCGPSGVWGLDIDAPSPDHSADGIKAFAELAKCYPPLPQGPRTRSGGGGLALFFRHNGEPISGKTGYPEPGIDPRRGRLSVTVPPSIHHRTHRPYRWINAPWDTDLPSAPDWLLSLVKPPPEPELKYNPNVVDDSAARRALIKAMLAVRNAPSGTANDTLNRRAYYVARCVAAGAITEIEAVEALYAAALDRKIPRTEARDTIRSAFRSGLSRPVERV